MTHPFDVLYRLNEGLEENGVVPVSQAFYDTIKPEFDHCVSLGYIYLDNGLSESRHVAMMRFTDKGKKALVDPDKFFTDLDKAEFYFGQSSDDADISDNAYFRNIHTGSLVNCRQDTEYMYTYQDGWRELTEAEYLDEINFAANDAAERDRLEDTPMPTAEEVAENFLSSKPDFDPKSFGDLPFPSDSWLYNALLITTSDRRRDYGHPLPNFLRICLKWSVTLQIPVTPLQVAQMMLDMKTARDQNSYKDDNWVDSIGYSNTVQMMDERMRDMGYTDGIKTFQMFEGDNKVGWMYRLLQQHEAKYEQGT